MIQHKKILITGSTGTIGSALTRRFAGLKTKIALHYNMSLQRAEALLKEIECPEVESVILQADLSHIDAVERLVSEARDKLSGLDVLIHAASIFERMPFGGVTEGEWDRIMALDLKAAFFLAQAAGLAMQHGGGKMIFFSDVAGIKPYAGYLPYCISKAGVNALVKGLAKSLAPKVQVNAVASYVVTRPKGVSDNGWNDILSKMPMRKPQTVEEITAIVETLVFSGESITGQVIAIDGGRLLR